MIPSHASYEIGYRLAMDAMGLQPLFLLGMRLGGKVAVVRWHLRC